MLAFDFIASLTELYDRTMAPVSRSFSLTATELSILLFLSNNPEYDTAREIVEKRHLSKSHVSISLRDLEERGLLKKEHRNGDNRTVHLVVLSACEEILREGRKAQEDFLAAVTAGFSESEAGGFHDFVERMNGNVLTALQEKEEEKYK